MRTGLALQLCIAIDIERPGLICLQPRVILLIAKHVIRAEMNEPRAEAFRLFSKPSRGQRVNLKSAVYIHLGLINCRVGRRIYNHIGRVSAHAAAQLVQIF